MKGKLLFAAMAAFALTAFILFCGINSAYADKYGNGLYVAGGICCTALALFAGYLVIKDTKK